MAIEEEDEGKVPGPTIQPLVVAKFMLVSALMVATPTSLFFLSMYGYLDGAMPSCAVIVRDSSSSRARHETSHLQIALWHAMVLCVSM
jgi:hypothetical protein